MEAKLADTYIEEFEPLCKWQRKEDRDVLEIHLQEFKMEQLKVQKSNLGILKISGERPLGGSKKSKFYKEVPIPKYFDSNAIGVKFVNGCLYIEMPKRISIEAVFECAVWPTLRTLGKVVLTLAELAALIAYVVYMYRSMVPQDDKQF